MYEMQRKLTMSSLRTGWVVSIALVVLFCTVFFSGNIASLLEPSAPVLTYFSDVKGLLPSAPIWLRGIEVGRVKSIELRGDRLLVALAIKKRFLRSLDRTGRAEIRNLGLLGDKYIEITGPGTVTAPLRMGDTIAGLSAPPEMDQVVASGTASLARINLLVARVDTLAARLLTTQGTAGKLINDPSLHDELVRDARSINAAADEIRAVTRQVGAVAEGVQNGKGTVRRLIDDPRLYDTLLASTSRLSTLVSRAEQGKGIAGQLFYDTTLLVEMKRTLGNVNTLIDDVRRDPKKYFKFSVF